MKYIKEITKEQEAQMKPYADKWIEIGLRTGEADFATFDKYMPICYEKAGIAYPKNIVIVQSPLVGALASSIAEQVWKKRDAVDGAVRDAVDGAVSDAVSGAVSGAVDGAVSDAVGDAVSDAVSVSVRDAVGDAVSDAVSVSVRGSVDVAVRGAVLSKDFNEDVKSTMNKYGVTKIDWHYWLGGQFWVGYWYWGVAYQNFFVDICGLELEKDIDERRIAYRKICESVNYIWPNRNFVMVCDRPKEILRDDDGRLHSLDRKAISYGDGWGLYMIHGVKFTEEQFEKAKTETMADILNWPDIEQRSVLLRDRPVSELLKECKAELVSETDKFGGYRLHEMDIDGLGKAKVLSFNGWSSDHDYAHFVPKDHTDALESIAFLFGMSPDEFAKASKDNRSFPDDIPLLEGVLRAVIHGDIILRPSDEVAPDYAVKASVHVLQLSPVSGNRHEVRGMKIDKWEKDGKMFISSRADFVIDHIGPSSEHGTVKVAEGTYEVYHQVEFDAIKQELRVVID
ncbi:MAG: hypothetical protein M0R06_02005 [Sphaerochaeta sp.]|jgi:hypothetical protein|nr:hypothetical protein [Sphaerochaeta sp.]